MTTISNPLDLTYRFQNATLGPFFRGVGREGADPSMVFFEGRYYLFVSMSAGFWHSDNMIDWEHAEMPGIPVYDYAPDVRIIDGQLVVCASRARKPCNFYRTSDPLGGVWEEIPGTFAFWDPNLFQDDDGRLYLYQGCSSRKPIDVVELDRTTFTPIGETVPLIASDVAQRGWERLGENWDPSTANSNPIFKAITGAAPYIEGAWLTKHDGVYYLQYSAPGTEINTYSDGYYTASSPMGPFTYSPHSPFSSKPGGFIPGAGHGSTMQDAHGNWWHVATMRISKNFAFERRIGLFPAGFDANGVLFCNQEFADYPMVVPDGPADPWSLTAQSMLLSHKTLTTASSSAPGHGPERAVDENVQTWWVAGDSASGHWIQTELPEGSTVTAVQINLAEHNVRPPRPALRDTSVVVPFRRHIYPTTPTAELLVQASTDGVDWVDLEDTRGSRESRSHLYLELDTPTPFRFIRVTGFAQPFGATLAVSGLRVFGNGSGPKPGVVRPLAMRTGDLDGRLDWQPVPGAHGYNVRYGVSADALYSSWLVYDQNYLSLGSLNAGSDYWVAVDSFNENGVTRGAPVRMA
jgi:xylan 1,4-beta-xylosidase